MGLNDGMVCIRVKKDRESWERLLGNDLMVRINQGKFTFVVHTEFLHLVSAVLH